MSLVREILWASGFMEGEASFGFYNATPIIQVRQCNCECLERLAALFGGKIRSEKISAIGKKPIFAWKIWSTKAIGIMMTVYPLMSTVRQEKIVSVIQGWKRLAGTQGESHPRAQVSDAVALAALRRVLQGESIVLVATEIGIRQTTLYNLVAGRARDYLLRELEAEGLSTAWMFPDGHLTRTHLADDIIVSAMRRIRDGEALSRVAASLGVNHGVVSQWMSGKSRRELLRQVKAEAPESTWQYQRRQPRRASSDEELFTAMVRVQGGGQVTRVACETGVDRNALSCCMRGLTRPHLLARLQQEASVLVTKEG